MNWIARLFLECGRPAIPKLNEIKTTIKNRWRVNCCGTSLPAGRIAAGIGTVGTNIVTAGAGGRVIAGKSLVVKQLSAQGNFAEVEID